MRAWFQKTLSTQSPAVTAVLHNIRRLREQHAWFPLTRHERVEERSSRIAEKQRELPLLLDFHTDRLPRRSAVEEVCEYVRAPINKRLIVYPLIAIILIGWIVASFLPFLKDVERTDTIASRGRTFNLTFMPSFLHDSLAIDMAYQ